MKKEYQNFGFTLSEMLIVVTIFVLIIIAVYSVYTLSQRGYLGGEEIAEITQNGRVVLERMSREIRQAKVIAMKDFPTERVSAKNEIIFHDGHSEFGTARGGNFNTIVLTSDASGIDNYYKNMTIQVIEGPCSGQLREVTAYDGDNQTATVGESWAGCATDTNSEYKVFGSYHYIHYYFQSSDNSIQREVIGYYVFGDSEKTLVSWGTDGTVKKTIEAPKIIGEYVTNLEFWGARRIINISLILEKGDKSIELKTKIFGRNL